MRRQPFLGHDTFHIFHDDNGVIHQQSNDNDQGKHGQGIDGETAGSQNSHGSQKYHRHRDGGDHGGADVLQEEKHDDEDQKDSFDQGVYHLFNGNLDKGG